MILYKFLFSLFQLNIFDHSSHFSFKLSKIGNNNLTYSMMLFPLYISFNGRSRSFFSKTGEGGGRTVRFLYAVNVVILIIFFFSFHNNTSVVWISKTVSIDANYLLKLETFLIHFDEGKGTCMRSSEEQLFPGEKKRKKRW